MAQNKVLACEIKALQSKHISFTEQADAVASDQPPSARVVIPAANIGGASETV